VPRTYDAEFRRRVLELVRAGRPVRLVAAELGLAEATVYRWMAQDLIDCGVKPGTTTSEQGELAAARRRIRELETELAVVKQAAALFLLNAAAVAGGIAGMSTVAANLEGQERLVWVLQHPRSVDLPTVAYLCAQTLPYEAIRGRGVAHLAAAPSGRAA
jgi:transposase